MLCGSLNGGEFEEAIHIQTYMYAESLHCSPETIARVLIACTPIYN